MVEGATENRFRFLVCIDGTDESYRGVNYAAEFGPEHDICLCYVRPMDRGLRSGGLNVRIARENMLTWGLELPGITYLKKGRDILLESGAMGPDWQEQATHVDVEGDPLGDNKIEYTAKSGKKIILKLKVAYNIPSGIIEQTEVAHYDLIIMGASERWRKRKVTGFWDPAVAEKVVDNAPCPVLVARELDTKRGHLLCTDGSEWANKALRDNAFLASHGNAPVSILSVAPDVEGEEEAKKSLAELGKMLTAEKIQVKERYTRVGDPVEQIIEGGENYSVIVLSESVKSPWDRFFKGSVSQEVMRRAENSVMIVR
jgi:nucleotide-binding universal stress UspA family protein